MKIEKIHHVAYRCKDAKETVEWYGKNLNMDFILAIAEDKVPSTHEPDPYMHIFLDAGDSLPGGLPRANRRPWGAIVRLDDLPRLAVQLYLTLAANQ